MRAQLTQERMSTSPSPSTQQHHRKKKKRQAPKREMKNINTHHRSADFTFRKLKRFVLKMVRTKIMTFQDIKRGKISWTSIHL